MQILDKFSSGAGLYVVGGNVRAVEAVRGSPAAAEAPLPRLALGPRRHGGVGPLHSHRRCRCLLAILVVPCGERLRWLRPKRNSRSPPQGADELAATGPATRTAMDLREGFVRSGQASLHVVP